MKATFIAIKFKLVMIAPCFRYFYELYQTKMARTVAGAGGGSGVWERLAGPVQIEEKIVFGGEMTSF